MADIADQILIPFFINFSQLISDGKPTWSQIVISSKDFQLLSSRRHKIDYLVELIWLLGLASVLAENYIIGYLAVHL